MVPVVPVIYEVKTSSKKQVPHRAHNANIVQDREALPGSMAHGYEMYDSKTVWKHEV